MLRRALNINNCFENVSRGRIISLNMQIIKLRLLIFFVIFLLFCQFVIIIDRDSANSIINIEFGKTTEASISVFGEMDT